MLYGLPVKDALRSMAAMYRIHEEDVPHFKKPFRLEFSYRIRNCDHQSIP